jgi:ABC-type phosphate/phosphonate transport system permease subunit
MMVIVVIALLVLTYLHFQSAYDHLRDIGVRNFRSAVRHGPEGVFFLLWAVAASRAENLI